MATCVKTENVDNNAYQLYGMNVYTNEIACQDSNALNMYTMEYAGTILCVTRQTCVDNGRFVFYRQCLTAAECSQKKTCDAGHDSFCKYYYVYAALKACLYDRPGSTKGFDQAKLEENIYDCGDKYLDTRTLSCVAESSCAGTDDSGSRMILYRNGRMCMTD